MLITWGDYGTWHTLDLNERSIVTEIGEKFDIIQEITNFMVNERLDYATLARSKDGEMIMYNVNLKKSFFGKPELIVEELNRTKF